MNLCSSESARSNAYSYILSERVKRYNVIPNLYRFAEVDERHFHLVHWEYKKIMYILRTDEENGCDTWYVMNSARKTAVMLELK